MEESVLDWHMNQISLYAKTNYKSRAIDHLLFSEKHLKMQLEKKPDLILKFRFMLAKAAALSMLGLKQDAVITASQLLAESELIAKSVDQQQIDQIQQLAKELLNIEVSGSSSSSSRPHSHAPKRSLPIERPSRSQSTMSTRSRFLTSRPDSAPDRRKRKRERGELLSEFMFASGKEELKVRARMTANLYDPEDRAELSKVFSAAGLAASKHGAAMRGKIRIPEKPKEGETLDVTGLIHSLKDSHEHQSINDALLELGLITKVEKPVDVAIVFNMQGLLLKVSS